MFYNIGPRVEVTDSYKDYSIESIAALKVFMKQTLKGF
jgi:hypothetical protein